MAPVEGVDYSRDHPSIRGLAAIGKRFACRYVGPGTADKHLTPTEATELIQAGLAVVSNAEGVEDGLLGGWNVGVDWARRAHAHAVRCGMPPDRPIYLSVDFNATAAQWPAVAEALRGAASVLGPSRVGVYGGYNTIAWSARDRVARWWWQTYAWSDERWHPLAHIQQYRNRVSLVGGTVDLDRAMVVDYGQWGVAPAQVWEDEDVKHLREQNGGIYRQEGTDPATGLPVLWAVRAEAQWEEYSRNGDRYVQIDTVDWRYYKRGEELPRVTSEASADLQAKVDQLLGAPLIDPVAVAAAIAAHPEIAATLASKVAERLATIEGTMTLSGGLTAGIRTPAA